MNQIRVAIVGVGSCASALVQGVDFYRNADAKEIPGVMFPDIGGYHPRDIKFVAAYDVDKRKVGRKLVDAIFAKPNCCIKFNEHFSEEFQARSNPTVYQGPTLDGVAAHMADYPEENAFRPLPALEECLTMDEIRHDVVEHLKLMKVDVLLNYLPVGSQRTTEFWMECCLEAGVAVVNCIPVFIASDPEWAQRFANAGIPIIGDDMRSQFGASIVSAVLQELAFKRGHEVQVHYQDNVGGNTDFLNMQDQGRLASKKVSKENVIKRQNDIAGKAVVADSIAAGPAKYFPDLGDNKRAHWLIRMTGFGGAPVEFTADLSVQDSPNSAGVVIDAIRFLMVARSLGIVGPIYGPSAFTQKTPPIDMRPNEAWEECRMLAEGRVPLMQSMNGQFKQVDIDFNHQRGCHIVMDPTFEPRVLCFREHADGGHNAAEVANAAEVEHHKVIEHKEVGIPSYETYELPERDQRPPMPAGRDVKERGESSLLEDLKIYRRTSGESHKATSRFGRWLRGLVDRVDIGMDP